MDRGLLRTAVVYRDAAQNIIGRIFGILRIHVPVTVVIKHSWKYEIGYYIESIFFMKTISCQNWVYSNTLRK